MKKSKLKQVDTQEASKQQRRQKTSVKSFQTVFIKRLLSAFLIPVIIIFFIVTLVIYHQVKINKESELTMFASLLSSHVNEELEKYTSIVETAAMAEKVISLDYTVVEPYLLNLMEKSQGNVWSHFVIANQYGTEQANTFGTGVHGGSLSREDCFRLAWDQNATVISAPYKNKSTGQYVLSISTPIYREDKKIGVLIGFVNLDYISAILNEYSFSENSYAFMINNDGTVSAHPDSTLVLKQNWLDDTSPLTTKQKSIITAMTAQESGIQIADNISKKGPALYAYLPIGKAGLSLAIVSPITEIYGIILSLLISFALALLFILLFGLLSAASTSSKIAGLLTWVVKETSLLATGTTTLDPFHSAYSKTREMMVLQKSFTTLAHNLESMLGKLNTESALLYDSVDIASGQLEHSSTSLDDILTVVEEFSAGIENTCVTVDKLSSHSEKNYSFTETIATYAMEGSQLANETMSHSNDVMVEMEKGITDTTEILGRMQKQLEAALVDSQKVDKIKSLVGDILEIADKTNLLSLNASIEAARANEAGKGFAVIASEIRDLSTHSQKTALHIRTISQEVTETLGALTNSASQILTFLTNQVLRDYHRFLQSGKEQNKNAKELDWIMNKFSNHAVELKEEFAKINGGISTIKYVMEENKSGIHHILGHTSSLSVNLIELQVVIEKCKTSASTLQEEYQAGSIKNYSLLQ